MINTSQQLRTEIEKCDEKNGRRNCHPYITQCKRGGKQLYFLNVPMKHSRSDVSYKINPDLFPSWWSDFRTEASVLSGYLEEKESEN
ncbi:hypothetical protein N9137_02210 [Pseudomonadales bacterium]|nr:hypothetical protein [Pseudomonadales bacterium]